VLRFEVEFSRNLEFNSEKDRDVTNLVSFLCEMLFSMGTILTLEAGFRSSTVKYVLKIQAEDNYISIEIRLGC